VCQRCANSFKLNCSGQTEQNSFTVRTNKIQSTLINGSDPLYDANTTFPSPLAPSRREGGECCLEATQGAGVIEDVAFSGEPQHFYFKITQIGDDRDGE